MEEEKKRNKPKNNQLKRFPLGSSQTLANKKLWILGKLMYKQMLVIYLD
jgi:hypothetical protein